MSHITSTKSLQKYSISDRSILNKRLKTSSRYANVKSKTNSGFNRVQKEALEKELKKYYRVRNDEIFRRISLGDLLQLIVVYAEECNLTRLEIPGENLDTPIQDEGENTQESEENNKQEARVPLKFKDDIHEIVHKMNELDFVSSICPDTVTGRQRLCPFLILDVRSCNDFTKGHLVTALCYPHTRLSRAVGWECPELLVYKNHSEWIIVICDDNELLSPGVASILIQRGYTNVFVLSGGLKLAKDKIGSPLVTTDTGRVLSPTVANFLSKKLCSLFLPPLKMEAGASWWAAKASKQYHQRSRSLDSGMACSKRGKFISTKQTTHETKRKHWK